MDKLKPIKIPEIRIKWGWLLTDAFYKLRKQIPGFENENPPTWEETKKVVANRKEIWEKVEKKIIVAMQKIAGLNFYQNIIDIYLIDGHKSAFSEPLAINYKYHDEGFIDVVTHELLHRLLTDNVQNKNGGLWPHKVYTEVKDRVTLNHILVHAIHKEIYLKTLKQPRRLEYDIRKCDKYPAYKAAWDIVEKEGHITIIEAFKKSKKTKLSS
jgi:hypothetical protein